MEFKISHDKIEQTYAKRRLISNYFKSIFGQFFMFDGYEEFINSFERKIIFPKTFAAMKMYIFEGLFFTIRICLQHKVVELVSGEFRKRKCAEFNVQKLTRVHC